MIPNHLLPLHLATVASMSAIIRILWHCSRVPKIGILVGFLLPDYNKRDLLQNHVLIDDSFHAVAVQCIHKTKGFFWQRNTLLLRTTRLNTLLKWRVSWVCAMCPVWTQGSKSLTIIIKVLWVDATISISEKLQRFQLSFFSALRLSFHGRIHHRNHKFPSPSVGDALRPPIPPTTKSWIRHWLSLKVRWITRVKESFIESLT